MRRENEDLKRALQGQPPAEPEPEAAPPRLVLRFELSAPKPNAAAATGFEQYHQASFDQEDLGGSEVPSGSPLLTNPQNYLPLNQGHKPRPSPWRGDCPLGGSIIGEVLSLSFTKL